MLFWILWLLVPFAAAKQATQTKQKAKFISLQRMDAIADLAALALKYFSEDQQYLEQASNLKSVFATSEAVTAVAMELSTIWDETESPAYALTRMTKLIDERDGEGGQFSTLARIIRAMAASSLQRNVHMSIAGGSEDFEYESFDESENFEGSESYEKLYKSSTSTFDKELWRIEELYRSGELETADELVQKWISARWQGVGKNSIYFDILGAAARGHYATLTAFILAGRSVPALASFTPQQKAEIAQNLMNATDAQLAPAVMKWLLTMDTFREDQLTLLKMIQEAAAVALKSGRRNSVTELFVEIEQIPQENNVKHLIENIESIEDENNDIKAKEIKVKEMPADTKVAVETKIDTHVETKVDTHVETKIDTNSEIKIDTDEPIEIPIESPIESPAESPAENPQENEPITSQGNSDESSSNNSNGPWYLVLALIFIVFFIIFLSIGLYVFRNFRRSNISQPNF
jgi:hypothetical protein